MLFTSAGCFDYLRHQPADAGDKAFSATSILGYVQTGKGSIQMLFLPSNMETDREKNIQPFQQVWVSPRGGLDL